VKQLDGTGMKRLHREWRHRGGGRLALVLEDVQGPFNVGAIVRTAASYRVEEVWCAVGTPPLDNAKVGKTALGCERYLRWHMVETGAAGVDRAHAAGYQVVGLELAQGAVPLHEATLGDDVCLVIGHEDRGVRPATLERCDLVAYLPQLGRVGSLNVATATSIALYELRRRIWA
jgi:tRNA (guanosine-2'-O-)-methyltransferase